jgi:hypothetical protein
MEHLILAAALAIMGVGLVATVLGLIEFTKCFGDDRQDPAGGTKADPLQRK